MESVSDIQACSPPALL